MQTGAAAATNASHAADATCIWMEMDKYGTGDWTFKSQPYHGSSDRLSLEEDKGWADCLGHRLLADRLRGRQRRLTPILLSRGRDAWLSPRSSLATSKATF